MKNIRLLIILMALTISGFSQELAEKYGYVESERMILDNTLKKYPWIIGHDTNGFFALKEDYVNFLEYYSPDLEMIKESDFLKVDYKLKDRQFNAVVYFQDSLYMFYSEMKFLRTYLYVKSIDKNTLEQNGNERMICEIPHFKGNFPEVHFRLSLLHNKLLMVFKTDAYLQKTIKFDFFVFDEGLKIDWQKVDYFQYNHRAPREMTFTIDEEGNVHILSLIYEIRFINHIITNESLKNEYLVVSYLDKGEEVVENNISLEDRFIRGIKLIAVENGSYICSGFYSHLFRYGIKGAFFVSNNTLSKQNEPILYYEFEDDMFNKLPDQSKSFKTDEIFSFKVKDLVYRKNGNIVLCGEQVYNQSYNNVNDIIVVAFDPYGKMLWNRSISKIQSGNEYVSFTFVAPVTENDVCVLYNENHKNPLTGKIKKRKSFHFSTPSYLVLVKIDQFGNIKKEKLFSRSRKELIPDPEKTYDMRNGEIVMYKSRYRKYKYFKLNLF